MSTKGGRTMSGTEAGRKNMPFEDLEGKYVLWRCMRGSAGGFSRQSNLETAVERPSSLCEANEGW